MATRFDTISFLSDYGLVDEFVGVVKSVIRSIAPTVTVIDVTHDIAPHDVRGGGLALARSAQYLVPGVVVAVVDPGVGTDRRAIAVEVGDGESVLVGPDNGLLAPAVGFVGGATRAVALENPDYRLASPGSTFDGRDVFAPAAAHLCAGVALDALGPEIDPSHLRPGVIPMATLDGDVVEAQVLWVDRFGNLQLNVGLDDLGDHSGTVRLRFGEDVRSVPIVQAFADLARGQLGLVTDSYGLLALTLDQHPAAVELGLGPGDEVTLEPLVEAHDGEMVDETPDPSPVTLSRRPRP
jgi:S-adenosylmethionine hydrolase